MNKSHLLEADLYSSIEVIIKETCSQIRLGANIS